MFVFEQAKNMVYQRKSEIELPGKWQYSKPFMTIISCHYTHVKQTCLVSHQSDISESSFIP